MVICPGLAAGGDVDRVVGIEQAAAVGERGERGTGGVPLAVSATEPGGQFADPFHLETGDSFLIAVVGHADDS